MKKIIKINLLLLALIFLTSCNGSKNINVNLYLNESELYQTLEVKANESFDLPITYTSSDTVFVGWNDSEDTLFSGQASFSEDIDLYLVEENAADVFEYYQDDSFQISEIYIEGYTGYSLYLRIPSFIDQIPVKGIQVNAFSDSNLVEVFIPNSVDWVQQNAFSNSLNLTKVTFYGEAYGLEVTTMQPSNFDELISEYSDVCNIVNQEDNVYTYSEGCPVVTAEKSEPVVISGVEYFIYTVTIDNSLVTDLYTQLISPEAFLDCTSLEEVVMPIGGKTTFSDAFMNTPNLKTITFREDHEQYKTIDGVVFSVDESIMVYYPGGKDSQTYDVLESVTRINSKAFTQNDYLKELNIPSSVIYIGENAFINLSKLEEINVNSTNELYYSVDGVLYLRNEELSTDYLIKYPANKSGNLFAVPEVVDYIGYGAFSYNKNLTNIVLNEEVLEIDSYAFAYSEGLVLLNIVSSVYSLGRNILEGSNVSILIVNREVIYGEPSVSQDITVLEDTLREDSVIVTVYAPDEFVYLYELLWDSSHVFSDIKPISEYEE